MNLITIDFETYYDKNAFSLSKMTTEEYVRDFRFEVIGVAVKLDNNPTEWASGTHEELKNFLLYYPWDDSMMVAHNTMFDGFIMTQVFGIKPKLYADTLSMARALHGVEVGGSLAVLAERYNLGQKGTEVLLASGKRREDFSAEDIDKYGDYCINDVELTYNLFHKMMAKGFPKKELKLIDLTLRMFVEPKLELNLPLLEQHLEEVKAKKKSLLGEAGIAEEELSSNPKFAEVLRSFGVEPPMKISPTTGKETFAFAKNDEGFKELASHPDVRVQTIVAARLGTKSTLEETRTERFIGIGQRGLMPAPLKYYAAHTGRWGGSDSLNIQNLPSRGENGNKLKKAIVAPKGYVVIDADSSQIEARVLAWLADQNDLVSAFKDGEDVYKIMASAIYGKPVDDITKEERFVGKTTILGCISEGTLVLCNSGWKPIEMVTTADKLWDGEEWVCHSGLVKKGIKPTLSLCGMWLTPDHKILCGTEWKEAQSVVQDENTLYQALVTGAENLPLLDMLEGLEVEYPRLSLNAIAQWMSTPLIPITSKILKALDVTFAQKSVVMGLGNFTGATPKLFQTIPYGSDYLTAYQVAFPDATRNPQKLTRLTVGEVFTSINRGGKTERSFLNTLQRYLTGKTLQGKLIGLTIIKGMNRAILDLLLGKKTRLTSGKSQLCRRNLMTYDIAYAGPRNRFTVATDAGPVIVHNCGYGMGAVKFRTQLKTFGAEISEDEARHIIAVYRDTYPWVVALWRQAQEALLAIVHGAETKLGSHGVLEVIPRERAIRLPSGLLMRYDLLMQIKDEQNRIQFQYKTRYGWNKIYGGKVIENVCQALARCIIGEQMVKVAKKYDVVLTVHDAIACIARKEEAKEAQAYIEECMRWTPDWAVGLPVNCESGFGESYGDC